jgi:hypothetical protein
MSLVAVGTPVADRRLITARSNNSVDSAQSARAQVDLDGDLDAVPISL